MTPQYLRERIDPQFKQDREDYLRMVEEEERLWEQGLPLIQYQDDLDERHLAQGQSVRSAHNAQRRGVERLFRLMCNSTAKAYWPEMSQEEQQAIASSLLESGWLLRIMKHFNEHAPLTPKRETRIAQNRKDVKDNFLYNEWMRQSRRPDGMKVYATYALFTCLRAALILMLAKPGANGLIPTFYTGELPDREELLKISEWNDTHLPKWHEVMGKLLMVPNMLELAEALMLHYADFVRAERVDKAGGPVLHSPLPDDPLEQSLPDRYEIPMDIRIESAVQSYIAKEGSADKIATKYEIPQKQFRQVLQDRQLIGSRGGDRKGKSVG